MLSFLKLIRLPNLLILILSLVMVQYFIVVPILTMNGMAQTIDAISFWCVALSAALMMAGGFIINDYYDVQTDSVNKPEKLFVGKTFSKNVALNYYIALTVAGVLIGLYAGWRLKYYGMMSITPLPAILLWFYSTSFKQKPFIGNFTVAFLCGGILLLPLLFNINTLYTEGLPYVVSAYAAFAFLTTLAREIIKDMEDMEGDERSGCRTLPIVAGIKFTKGLLFFLLLIVLFFIGWFQLLQFKSETFYTNEYLSFSYISLFIQLPLIYLLVLIYKAKDKVDYHSASSVAKIIMITGILSMVIFWWLMRG